jgi:PTH2 family peptidyl-tRNA hydrolase
MKVLLDLMTKEEIGGLIKYSFYASKDLFLHEWLSGLFTKIVVSVDSEVELLKIYTMAKVSGLLCSLIQDAGNTEFHGVPTYTCCAIGPDEEEKIDKITGNLKLL